MPMQKMKVKMLRMVTGVRSEVGQELSDVVLADTFDKLDSGLDGCDTTFTTPDDVSLNVRLGPSTNMPLLGHVFASDVLHVWGTSASGGWYRIEFDEGFAWILSSTASVDTACSGLRVFDDGFNEDPAQYSDAITVPEFTPTETPSPDSSEESDSETDG